LSLDRQKLEALIAQNLTLHIYETLPSTNQTLWELIKVGIKPRIVVIAAQQTAGRGQRGHQWYSPLGGLYLSYALAPNIPVADSFQLTLRTAWGIATVLRDRGIPVQLKWLNDLVLNNRKLGGILTETKVKQGIITKAAIGVGINWINPVPETGINLTSFLATIPSLEMLAAITIQGIVRGMNEPTETLLPAYEQLLTTIGRSIFIDGRNGVVVGVNCLGYLRVRLEAEENTPTGILEVPLKPGSISLGYK
jgi:BirA family transcriptional regulator, biotin operon repressor / biotin---[acetyl-CoA-carboxylase] ligase